RVLQRRKRFVDRGAVIPYVDLPQIQMVDSQELQRGIKLIEQTTARGVTDDAVGALPESRLGCQYDPFAQSGFCQQRPDQRLSSAAAVDRSGIYQGSAVIDECGQLFCGIEFVYILAPLHGAQPVTRDLWNGGSEPSRKHTARLNQNPQNGAGSCPRFMKLGPIRSKHAFLV